MTKPRRSERRKGNKNNQESQPDQWESEDVINGSPLKAMNPIQENYIACCRNKGIVVCTGFAGTSKTYIATRVAIEKYVAKHISKIVIVRPNVSGSKSLGYFSGDLVEKVKNWIQPVLDILEEFLGRSNVEYMIKHGDIDCVPLETIKGRSFKDSFVIIDEAEDLTQEEFMKCVTRKGKNCTMVFCGDVLQTDIKGETGLKLAATMACECPQLKWGYVNFDRPSDIVRSDEVRETILEFRRRGLM